MADYVLNMGDFVLALGGRGTSYLNTIDVFQIINK